MYNSSKYTTWYYNIINYAIGQARKRGELYYERHHVIPKSMGGTNKKENLVLLTAREHYICHLLLPKMCTSSKDKAKMVYAFMRLSSAKNQYRAGYAYTGRTYERLKKKYANSISGPNCYMYGKAKSEIIRQKIGKTRVENKIGVGENNPMFGRQHTEEAKLSMSESKKKKHKQDPNTTLKYIRANPKSKPIVCHNNIRFNSLSEAGRFYGFVGSTGPRRRIAQGAWRYL